MITTDPTQPLTTLPHGFVALVVDHDPASRLNLCGLIESEGGQAIEAKNVAGALTAFRERRPDIVLLDTTLTETGGFDACEQIQALPHGSDTPVLMMIAFDDESSVNLVLTVGAADYVTKPIRPSVLRQRIRRLLQMHSTDMAILRAKKEWEAAVDSISDMVILTDLNGRIIRCNLTTIQRLQTTYSQLIGRDLGSVLLHDAGRNLNLPLREPHEIQFPSLPGWFEACTFSAHGEGHRRTVVYVLKDITARKQREAELRQNELRFQMLTENISEGIMLYDAGGKIIYFNPTVTRLTGYGQEMLGESALLFGHPDDIPHVQNVLVELMEHPEKTITSEFHLRHKDGSYIWIESSLRNMLAEPGINAILVNFRDITPRKQLEEALRKSEARFRLALDTLPIVVSNQDQELRYTWLYNTPPGFDPAIVLGKTDAEILQDANRLTEIKRRVIETGIGTHEEVSATVDGQTYIHDIKIEPLHDPKGNCMGLICAEMDITERREVERRLRQVSQAVEQSPISIVITDRAGNIEYVNPRFTQLTGYTSEEAIGQNPRLLKTDQTPPETHTQLWEAITAGHEWFGEFINKKKNGEIFIERASISPVVDEHGVITHFLALKENITERKKLEAALQQSEKRFRAMIENSADAVTLIDARGIITYASSAIAGISGYTPDHYLGHKAFEFIHPRDLPELINNFHQLVQVPGSIATSLFRSQHSTGSWRWVDVTVSNQLTDPAIQAIIVNFRDVTGRKQAEEALHASEARYRSLFEDSPVALWEEDFSEVKAFFDRLRAEEGITDFQAYFEAHPEAVSQCLKKIFVKDVNKATLKMLGASSKEELLGKLDTAIYLEDQDAFREELISIANGCTRYTAEGPNRTLNGEIRHVSILWSVGPGYEDTLSNVTVSVVDLTERKLAEEKLKQTEERLRLIVETVPVPILISSMTDGTILFANTPLGEMFGVPVDELLGRHTPDFYFDRSQRQLLIETLNREGSLHNYELVVKRADQTPLWVLVSMQPLMFANQPALLAALYDVTERNEAEAALAESEQRFRHLFAASPDAVMVIDPSHPVDWKIIDCNEAACQMNGYTREELIGQSIDLLNGTSGTAPERAAYLERLRREGILHLEAFHQHKDGHTFPVEISTTLFTLGGRELVLGIDRDITERKQAEEALRLSEERFQMVTHATNDAVWDLNLTTNEIWWNRGISSLFGYTGEQIGKRDDWWEDRLHPDDRAKVLASFQNALTGDGQFWSKEYRYRRADGTYAYVFDRAYIITNEQGTPVRAIGAMMDLTNRKQSEDALRAREQQLEEAQQIAHLGSWEWDFRTNVCTWSDELYRLFGYEPRSFTPDHESFFAFAHPDDRDSVIENVGLTFHNHQPYDFDFRIISVKGELRWLHGHGEFLKDKTGRPLRFRGTVQDITERKQAEEALRASRTQLSEALQVAKLAYWEYDILNDLFIFNDHLYSILHTTAAEEGGYTMSSDRYAQRFCHPDDREVVRSEIGKALNSTDRCYCAQLDHRILKANTDIGYISVRINVDRDEQGQVIRFYGANQDVTERKHMEEALMRSEELFSKAFHASPAPMGVTRLEDGLIIDVNASWEKLIGYERQAVVGRSILDLDIYVNPDDREIVIQQIRQQGKLIDRELKFKTASEKELVLVVSAQRVEIEGQDCLLNAFYDLTELKHMNEAMLASQKLADLGTLAAGVAHEMNSPLQVITGVSQSLLRKADNGVLEPDQLKRNLDVIHRNGWRCAEIVRSLHTYARNSGGPMEPADLNELVSDALLLTEHQLKSWANISVQTILAEDLPALTCDRNQITQVLINLLTNARDAMPDGGEITIATGQELKSDQLILQIRDTGKGIPDSIRNKIFDPFFTTKPLGKGTGLGLSIVAGIIRAHGGIIDINGAMPQGTTFTIRFPTKPPKLPTSDAVDIPGRFDDVANAHVSTSEQTNFVKEPSHDQDSSR